MTAPTPPRRAGANVMDANAWVRVLIKAASDYDVTRLPSTEVDYCNVLEARCIGFRGEVDWHADDMHPRYTQLLILRNDAGLVLRQRGRAARIHRVPMEVGTVILFDSHRPHAALRRENARRSVWQLSEDGAFIAAVREMEKKP